VAAKHYNWQRYWRPRGSSLRFIQDGFLVSPGKINSNVFPFDKVACSPCIVLLGEPGMGKTDSMKTIIETTKGQGHSILKRDLRAYSSEDTLVKGVFEHPEFQKWIVGTHNLHLFLDSFDECRIAIKHLAPLLADELQNYQAHCGRLILRIVCRTAVWPDLLEERLRELWGEDRVLAYELAPLTPDDVGAAAIDEDIDADQFLSEVYNREVGPLAAKPITLRLLLNLYKNEGKLPSSQVELYEKGCLLLAEETSKSYIESDRMGKLAPAERMAIAARIAAITIFSKKSAIWTVTDMGERTEDDVTIADLSGDIEIIGKDSIEIDAAAIKETINTGLFDSRGENRMGWSHQSYSEFLAARYLVQLQTPAEQISKMLVHPDDPDGRLIPQLQETAAWLASMVPSLFQEIMNREPKVLLQSDISSTDEVSRTALVEAVLKLYDEGKDFGNDWFDDSDYYKLKHSTIADQLRPFIVEREKGFLVRRAAIKMAEACQTISLQNDLADLALDTSQRYELRVYAARAVAAIGDAKTKIRLKPIITGEAGADPDRHLQLWGLRALWPDYLSVEEVFSLLSAHGLNGHFLSQDFVKRLGLTDLPVALEWVEKQPAYNHLDYYERTLANEVMLLAWENLSSPGVPKAFARAALSRIRHWDSIIEDRFTNREDLFSTEPYSKPKFLEQWNGDGQKRHLALEAIVSILSETGMSDERQSSSRWQSTFSKDVIWMIDRLQVEGSDQRNLIWAKLIHASCNWSDLEQRLAVIETCQNSPILMQMFHRELMALQTTPIEVDEDEAAETTEYNEEETSRINALPDQPASALVSVALDEFEAGNLMAWPKLNEIMRLEEDGTDNVDRDDPNLKNYPGWQHSDQSTWNRIIAAARKYLLDQDAQTSKWRGTIILWYPACAGYHALRLLYDEDQPTFWGLDDRVWKNWAPIIVRYQAFGKLRAEEETVCRHLVKIAYRLAPDEVIEMMLVEIDRGKVYVPATLENCWDERMGKPLLDKVKERVSKCQSYGNLLQELFAHNTDGTSAFVYGLLQPPLPSDWQERQNLLEAINQLMFHSRDAAWASIWPIIQDDVDFGRSLIGFIIDNSWRTYDKSTPFAKRLTEEQLADLYIWMLHQYPPDEDTVPATGAVSDSGRMMIAHWRDSILSHLKDRGTVTSCNLIKRIASDFPNYPWLKAQWLEAKAIYRQNSWQPLRPLQILDLAREQRRQLKLKADQRQREEIFRCLWVLECAAEGSDTYGETCGQGTAFMLADYGLVTCHHVLCPHVKAYRPDDPDTKYAVERVGSDENLDVAILRLIDLTTSEELHARMSIPLQANEPIKIVGFPNHELNKSGVLSPGEVIGFSQRSGIKRMSVNVPIISGTSGGPVLDSNNQVVGVAVKGAENMDKAGGAEHLIIPINVIEQVPRIPRDALDCKT
jgi:Trypsin-like peptidase domain